MKILFALGTRIILATDEGSIIVRDGSQVLFQFHGDRLDKINDAILLQNVYVVALVNDHELMVLNTNDNNPDGILVPILRVHLNETLGRHFASLTFSKLIRLREHFNTIHKIGIVVDGGDCVVFLPVSSLLPAHGPLLTSPLSTQLALEMVQRTISLVEFGYKAVEKSPCITQDLLCIRYPHPNVIGIEEVEQRRTFNRAANLLGFHPDINQHCMFPEQLRDRDIMRYNLFDDGQVDDAKRQDGKLMDWSVDDTFLFLGYQPAAAYCSLRRPNRHSWRGSSSLKRCMIFSHPLLSTAFNPQQRITGYSWHPTDRRLLAVTDSFGRVMVWDVQAIRLVCYHKSTRELQAEWPTHDKLAANANPPPSGDSSTPDERGADQGVVDSLILCLYYPSRGLLEYLDVWNNTVIHQETTIRDGIISERSDVDDHVVIINLEAHSLPLTYPAAGGQDDGGS